VSSGQRFEFGKNWQRYAVDVDESIVNEARDSLLQVFGDINGLRFLDVGSGSGLLSLAAVQLGAISVESFDYDPDAVKCTCAIKQRFAPAANHWCIREGSVLDPGFLNSLGQFDIVYSWGVLHHTGAMWTALDNVASSVTANGRLFVSIYNNQGFASRFWKLVKRAYNRSGKLGKSALFIIFSGYYEAIHLLKQLGDIRHFSLKHPIAHAE
jgi:2-polyprenyl-6-hydroxyphenyl methylase/3-demethylubiquinone-9 3-methyltransferase